MGGSRVESWAGPRGLLGGLPVDLGQPAPHPRLVKLLAEPNSSRQATPERSWTPEPAEGVLHPAWPSLEGLIRDHFSAVYALLTRLVGRREEAEDLAQECFVKVERARGRSGDPEADPRAYLLRSATNLASDWHRKRGRRGESDPIPPGAPSRAPGPVRSAEQGELTEALQIAVAGLPDPPRSSFVERVLMGREYGDVARSLGIEVGTVRVQVMNARKQLRRALAAHLEDEQ